MSGKNDHSMQELLSISENNYDLEKFNSDWEEVRSFIRTEGLDGIELVFANNSDGAVRPKNLVKSVHLPIWPGWTKPWMEPQSVPIDCDPFELATYYCASTPEKLQDSFCRNLERAADFAASYAVVHVSHIELDDVFTQSCRYGSSEILSAVASFFNTLCSGYPNGEPPVTLAFENLWTCGLTFRSSEEVEYFTELLKFDNWMFVLDTGHLMNGLNVKNESEGIQKILRTLGLLSCETMKKIRAVHFHCSTSGEYQKTHLPRNPPASFSTMSYREKVKILSMYRRNIDEHLPFSDSACREIIGMIHPDFLVHELVARTRFELHQAIQQQKSLMGSLYYGQ